MKGKFAALIGGSLVALGLSASAHAGLLVRFDPEPVSPDLPELVWNNNLAQGPGAVGQHNADPKGPGLTLSTPLKIDGIAGGKVNADNSTTFFDASLEFSGWTPSNKVVASTIQILPNPPVSITTLTQPLGTTTFQLKATDGTLLLEGTISSSIIAGVQGTSGASVQPTLDNAVSYTKGKIFDQLVADGAPTLGSFSMSLSEITSSAGAGLFVQGDYLAPFIANAYGSFSIPSIPEPASLGLLGLAALASLRRIRKA